jgi:hypothetical protein
MLACTESNEETSYNSAISTCETNQQCPEIYRAAERQCVRSGDLKPAGAETAHPKPKKVKGVLATRDTINDAEMKEHRDFTGVSLAPAEYRAETSRPGLPAAGAAPESYNCFFDYAELEQGSEMLPKPDDKCESCGHWPSPRCPRCPPRILRGVPGSRKSLQAYEFAL